MAKCLRYCLTVAAFLIFALGRTAENFHLAFWGVFLLMAANLIYGLERPKSRILFLFFHLTIFLFLMGRPFILSLRGEEWVRFDPAPTWFALTSLLLTLTFLLLGSIWAEWLIAKRRRTHSSLPQADGTAQSSCGIQQEERQRLFLKNMQNIALLLYFVAIGCSFVLGAEMLLYMQGRSYLEYYTSFSSQLPYPVTVASAMDIYFLSFFLAAQPAKRKAFLPLALYLLSAVPSLMVGLRNPIVQNAILIFLYYLIRDFQQEKIRRPVFREKAPRRWIGRLEKGILAVAAPLAVLFLSAYNDLRMGTRAGSGIGKLLGDFLYHQGVSFDVLCIGYQAAPQLPQGFRCYTFGSLIDYFRYGMIGRLLFGTQPLEGGNSLDKALYSNSYAHIMSYAAEKEEYLSGHGWGSSYILETYTDFGWLGILLFSLLLGFLLTYGMVWVSRNWLASSLCWICLSGIFMTPRAEALGWCSFLYAIQFWFPFTVCWLGAKLCMKNTRMPARFRDGPRLAPFSSEKALHLVNSKGE